MARPTESRRERQLREHIAYDTGESNVKPESYRAPNGTVPRRAEPVQQKTLGDAYRAVKGLFSDKPAAGKKKK